MACRERKGHARKFIMQNHGYKHVFVDAAGHIAGEGVCVVHGNARSKSSAPCKIRPTDLKVDLVCSGIPCQPFSKMRQANVAGSSRRSAASHHPGFKTVFEDFPDYLELRKPGMWLAEETEAFVSINPDTGLRYVDEFITACDAKGYAVMAMKVEAGIWMDWPRTRLLGSPMH